MDDKILLDRDKFEAEHRKWVKRTEAVECPELNGLMGLEEGIVTIEIIQADLSTQLWARDNDNRTISDTAEVIADFMRGTATQKELIETAMKANLDPEADFQIKLCQRCITNPKLSRHELIWISEYFPSVINRIAGRILEISALGAVKKNSKS